MFRSAPDPLKQRAGSRAGAMSVLTGIAALRSADEGRSVLISEIVTEDLDLALD